MQQHVTHLGHLLGSETRARLVTILVTDLEKSRHFRELIREADCGVGFARREIAELERMRVLRFRRTPRGLFFDVDPSHPLVPALRALVDATRRMDTGEAPPCRDERLPYEYRGDEFYSPRMHGCERRYP